MSGWMAPAEEKLKSNSTLLSNGPLTTDQISYVGSINYFGGFVGALSFGYLNSLFGSKRIVLFLAIPFLCVWLIIYFGNHYYCLLIARLVVFYFIFVHYKLFGFTSHGLKSFTFCQQYRLEDGRMAVFKWRSSCISQRFLMMIFEAVLEAFSYLQGVFFKI